MPILEQIYWLFILSIPVASISWTITHEEIFREPREFCIKKSKYSSYGFTRKFFYLFTCEYCFSHYIAILFIILTDFRLLISNWKGSIIAFFSIVWIANIYMSLLAFIRQDIKKVKKEVEVIEGQNI
jgi:hypothetical protein